MFIKIQVGDKLHDIKIRVGDKLHDIKIQLYRVHPPMDGNGTQIFSGVMH
jgi:hypothetical protein